MQDIAHGEEDFVRYDSDVPEGEKIGATKECAVKLGYDDVMELVRRRPPHTRTYEVASDVLERLPLDTSPTLRRMSDAEVEELAEYLATSSGSIVGPLKVIDHQCGHCDRVTTFLDFVKTAVDDGHHDREKLRNILAGTGGAWITIRGADGGRPVRCARCDSDVQLLPDGGGEYSEYSSSSYAYA
ncbi:hypothetical protein [Kitasatospora sp. NBC_00315]|uniref:hypothetical protein n=1 Tax=Kitasatospora sp. NBC_00315 TaxID=2975963 RepID=UPI00324E4C56